MYIPKYYSGKEGKNAIAFMKRFNFATITTSVDDIPTATHLPFIVSELEENIILTSHFARANDHWKHINVKNNLVIFSEPHAYISPTNYNRKENVPTWNYMAIHAYGEGKLISEPTKVLAILESMMDSFEPSYKKQWQSLPQKYRTGMMEGIVAFEIHVSKLQVKEKLSQNKKENERQSIIKSLSGSEHSHERDIAKYMEQRENEALKNK